MGYACLFIFVILIDEMFLYEPYVNDDDDTDTTAPMLMMMMILILQPLC